MNSECVQTLLVSILDEPYLCCYCGSGFVNMHTRFAAAHFGDIFAFNISENFQYQYVSFCSFRQSLVDKLTFGYVAKLYYCRILYIILFVNQSSQISADVVNIHHMICTCRCAAYFSVPITLPL